MEKKVLAGRGWRQIDEESRRSNLLTSNRGRKSSQSRPLETEEKGAKPSRRPVVNRNNKGPGFWMGEAESGQ